jgi:hypothetical protein
MPDSDLWVAVKHRSRGYWEHDVLFWQVSMGPQHVSPHNVEHGPFQQFPSGPQKGKPPPQQKSPPGHTVVHGCVQQLPSGPQFGNVELVQSTFVWQPEISTQVVLP